MDGREGLPVRLRENADQIDDCVGPLDRRPDSLVIENVRCDMLNSLRDRTLCPKKRIAHRNPCGCPCPGEVLDQVPADKARSTENRDLWHHLAKSQTMVIRLLIAQSLRLLSTMFIALKVEKWHIREVDRTSAYDGNPGRSLWGGNFLA